MAKIGSRKRLLNTFCNTTSPMEESTTQIRYRSSKIGGPSHRKISQGRSNQSLRNPRYTLLIKFLHNKRKKQESSYFRLQENKQIYPMSTLLNGGSTCLTRDDRTQRLVMQDRPSRCICSSTSTPRLSTVHVLHAPKQNLLLCDHSFWNESLTKMLLKITPIRYCTTKITREHSLLLLLGRHLLLSKNTERNEEKHIKNNKPINKTWFYNQLAEELSHAFNLPRILRLQIQYNNYGNLSSIRQNAKITKQNQTSQETDMVMSMDCRPFREVNGINTSNWRCITPCQIPAKRFIKILKFLSSQLGSEMSIINKGTPRIRLVDEYGRITEWITYSQAIASEYGKFAGNWTKIEKEFSINVRELKTIAIALQIHINKFNINNQQIKIFSDNTTALKYTKKNRGTASEILQELALEIHELCLKNNLNVDYEHIAGIKNIVADRLSRRGIEQTPIYQWTLPQKMFQKICKKWGTRTIDGFASNQDKRIPRYWSQGPDPQAEGIDAFQQDWPKRGLYLHPPWRLIPQVLRKAVQEKIEEAVLITPQWKTQFWWPLIQRYCKGKPMVINIKHKKWNLVAWRLLIARGRTMASLKKRTDLVYDGHWSRWVHWCQQQQGKIDPTAYQPKKVAKFLVEHKDLAYQTLNGYRSAIASVLDTLHPHNKPLAEQEEIKLFFKTRAQEDTKIPNIHQEIWDVRDIIQVVLRWEENNNLSLKQLQKKAIVLTSIATMWRPRSDLAKLAWRDVNFTKDENGKLQGMVLLARKPKEGKPKTSKIGCLSNPHICPVTVMWLLPQKTQDKRSHLNDQDNFFLSGIDTKKPWPIKEGTLANVIKEVMSEAGIDTKKYTPHTIRSASSTFAVQQGIDINQVKEHANWSLTSNTFEQYYYRPLNQFQRGTSINEAMFLDTTEKDTISIGGVESTRIDRRRNANTSVDEMEPVDMVDTRPWFIRWFNG
ncbi:hypothetical protein INT45_006983 [Circinella minor]|uniref:Tyr recombinase domain-containing protein n=1 Tax=Circinella minor TaxID=1195481 RepID=A0A8H7S7P3_9FUNG|nr:hypothetical protein INT45_006983 [Circinella minor]